MRVTVENGPRPAGRPDECFYCHEKIGANHKSDCVLATKLVKVVLKATMLVEVPQSFSNEDTRFWLTESSNCSSNQIQQLIEEDEMAYERVASDIGRGGEEEGADGTDR